MKTWSWILPIRKVFIHVGGFHNFQKRNCQGEGLHAVCVQRSLRLHHSRLRLQAPGSGLEQHAGSGGAVLCAPPIMQGGQDEVSIMQESVDQLALSMFDSLRLIPFSEEVKGGRRGVVQPQGQGADPVVLRRAVTIDAAWTSQVQSLAEGVLKQARNLDGLIDALPGAELREDQQMEACVPPRRRDILTSSYQSYCCRCGESKIHKQKSG